jgi:probable rRNA maturation factor
LILNRQRGVKVSISELQKFLVHARKALRLPAGSFSVCLVGEREITEWNRAYRGKARPTDVLSFPATGAGLEGAGAAGKRKKRRGKISGRSLDGFFVPPGEGASLPDYLGDVAIAPTVARRNARRFERTLEDEMRILILHGMLHLMGYDHETDSGQMERREKRLRRSLGLA